MRRFLFLTVLGLAFCIAESSARAGFVLYTNRADFDAATSGRTIVDFEGIAPDGGATGVPLPAGITLSGVNFSATDVNVPGVFTGGLLVQGRGSVVPGTSVLESFQSLLDPDIIAKLPGSFTAFGVDLSAGWVGPTQTVVTFTLSTGDTFTLTNTSDSLNPLTFIGLVSTDAFDSVTMSIPPPTSDSTALVIDNFTFGSGGSGLAVVPAPSSGMLMVIGLAAILGFVAHAARRRAAISA